MRIDWGIQYCDLDGTHSVRDISSYWPGPFGPGKKLIRTICRYCWLFHKIWKLIQGTHHKFYGNFRNQSPYVYVVDNTSYIWGIVCDLGRSQLVTVATVIPDNSKFSTQRTSVGVNLAERLYIMDGIWSGRLGHVIWHSIYFYLI